MINPWVNESHTHTRMHAPHIHIHTHTDMQTHTDTHTYIHTHTRLEIDMTGTKKSFLKSLRQNTHGGREVETPAFSLTFNLVIV